LIKWTEQVRQSARVKVEIHPRGKVRQIRRETDHEPFPDCEQLEENLCHQLERFAKRLKISIVFPASVITASQSSNKCEN
jgi:hypothetical protein